MDESSFSFLCQGQKQNRSFSKGSKPISVYIRTRHNRIKNIISLFLLLASLVVSFPSFGHGFYWANSRAEALQKQISLWNANPAHDPSSAYIWRQGYNIPHCPPSPDYNTYCYHIAGLSIYGVFGVNVAVHGAEEGCTNPLPHTNTCPPPPVCGDNAKCEKNLGGCSAASGVSAMESNPVAVGTGNKFQKETDFLVSQAAKRGGLGMVRYYNSQSLYAGPLGVGWTTKYFTHVSSEGSSTKIQRPDGKIYEFSLQGSEWVPDPDVKGRLSALVDGWEYADLNDRTERYDSAGRLLSITDPQGYVQTLSYDGTGLLTEVADSFGRQLVFTYDDKHRIQTITDPDGNSYSYSYDIFNNLVSVTYPDDTPADDTDNPSRTYHYEDSRFPNHLSGITDENGSRFATWAYDDQGRAILSEHIGGVDRVDITYNADGSTTVNDTVGASRTYSFTTLHGVVKPTSVTGDQCTSCGGQAQSRSYDANGFLDSKTDWNGHLTNYTYDARGLQVSRTEAVGTLEERTITTDWHPDFRLPTLITEPGKSTAFTYDVTGQLLTRTETDTVTQASHTRTYAYTAEGLLESVDGARTDVSDVTTFEYDAQGNRIAFYHQSAGPCYGDHGPRRTRTALDARRSQRRDNHLDLRCARAPALACHCGRDEHLRL